MDKWILQYITDISVVLSQIASYRKKNRVALTNSAQTFTIDVFI